MSAAFTPGPWELKPWQLGAHQRHRAIWAAMAPGYEARGVLAHTMGQRPLSVNTANANLIAAAPELFAELQQFVNGVETRMIESPADETLANIMRRAKAALAKARGELVPA